MGTVRAAVRDFFGWDPGRTRSGSAELDAVDAGCYAELLSECGRLRERARRAAVELDDSPRSLQELDRLLALWRASRHDTAWLSIEAGSYLGTVMTRNLRGALWQLGPDTRPVVRLSSGLVLDVLAIAADRASGATLACTYARACQTRRTAHHT